MTLVKRNTFLKNNLLQYSYNFNIKSHQIKVNKKMTEMRLRTLATPYINYSLMPINIFFFISKFLFTTICKYIILKNILDAEPDQTWHLIFYYLKTKIILPSSLPLVVHNASKDFDALLLSKYIGGLHKSLRQSITTFQIPVLSTTMLIYTLVNFDMLLEYVLQTKPGTRFTKFITDIFNSLYDDKTFTFSTPIIWSFQILQIYLPMNELLYIFSNKDVIKLTNLFRNIFIKGVFYTIKNRFNIFYLQFINN
jgi:hypothetical protein